MAQKNEEDLPTPQGIPGASACKFSLDQTQNLQSPVVGFVPLGLEIQPTEDHLANFLIATFNAAEVPPIPPPPVKI